MVRAEQSHDRCRERSARSRSFSLGVKTWTTQALDLARGMDYTDGAVGLALATSATETIEAVTAVISTRGAPVGTLITVSM